MKWNPDNGSTEDRGSRLDSWKEIAAYLKRDVRTAHRWERNEGLPVHRHQHGKAGTVYAYPAEIDAWLSQRSVGAGQPSVEAARHTRFLGIAATVSALIVISAAALWVFRPAPNASGEPVRMLVAYTENRTGEDRFDGVVDSYLESGLSSPRVQVIPPRRIVETLALMREPTDRDLDSALMLEIAARNPDVDLIAASTLDRFGTEYAITVDLLDPVSGAALDTVRVHDQAEREIPVALDAIADGVLDAVDEIDLPERSIPMGYEPVTTASLRAAELYWDANLLMFDNPTRMPAAEEQLRQAVMLDPEFATADIQLAHAIHEQGRPASDWAPFADRALELADTVSQAERYFITGSYHELNGHLDAAHAQFLALNTSYPEHFWGQVRMGELSHARGNLEGAAWSMAEAADLKPQSVAFNRQAFNFILTTPHPWTLTRIHERMFEISPPSENGNVLPFYPAEFYTVNDRLREGQATAALEELRGLRKKLDDLPEDVWTRRPEYAARLAETFVSLGRLQDAEELLQIVRDDDDDDIRNSPMSRMLDEQRLVSMLSVSRHGDCCRISASGGLQLPEFAILRVRSGQTGPGDTDFDRIVESGSPLARILRSEIALRNGELAAAIELSSSVLKDESERLRNQSLGPGSVTPVRREMLLVAASLATALIDDGRTAEAIAVLESWSDETIKVGALMSSPPFAPYWIDLRWRLEALYREVGRDEDAAAIRSYLESLLARADPDHYVAALLRAE